MTLITETINFDGCLEPVPRHKLFINHVESSSLSGISQTKLFSDISIGNNCKACGLCRRICPNQAIVVEDHGRVMDFYHNALTCTGCGVCAANCPQGAITIRTATSLGISHIITRELPLCQKCSKPYQPIGNAVLCLECSFEDNKIQF